MDLPGHADYRYFIHLTQAESRSQGPSMKPKRRAFNPKRYVVINEEVEKMISSGAIQAVYYP